MTTVHAALHFVHAGPGGCVVRQCQAALSTPQQSLAHNFCSNLIAEERFGDFCIDYAGVASFSPPYHDEQAGNQAHLIPGILQQEQQQQCILDDWGALAVKVCCAYPLMRRSVRHISCV